MWTTRLWFYIQPLVWKKNTTEFLHPHKQAGWKNPPRGNVILHKILWSTAADRQENFQHGPLNYIAKHLWTPDYHTYLWGKKKYLYIPPNWVQVFIVKVTANVTPYKDIIYNCALPTFGQQFGGSLFYSLLVCCCDIACDIVNYMQCEFSHTCMAEFALHSNQSHTGTFFWSAPESDCMGVHTHVIEFKS